MKIVVKGNSIYPEGELDIYSVKDLKETVLNIFNKSKPVVVDMSKVSSVDTAGIQFLISSRRSFAKADLSFRMTNHSLAVLKIIDLYGLFGFFGDSVRVNANDKKQLLLKYGLKRES